MLLSDFDGVVASETGLLVGENVASWSAGFHLSDPSRFLRPPLRDIQVQEASLSQPMNVNNSSIYSVYLTNPSWYQLFSVPTSPTCNWSVVPSVTPAPPPY